MDETVVAALLAATLRVSAPLILCALAGLYAERSGVIDIGLEGKMLCAAFAAGAAGASLGSTTAALLAAMAAAVALSWLHGLACVRFPGNQTVSGVAINMIAAGLTVVAGIAWYARGGQTPTLASAVRFQPLFPQAGEALSGIPWIGRVLGEGLLSHSALLYFAFAVVPLTSYLVFRTRFGLRLIAVGENPAMLDAAGVSVQRLRFTALTLNGMLCGLSGAYLTLAQTASFTPHMTAGRGFMALAALIFGRWRPYAAAAACLLFGFLDAVSIRLQGVVLPVIGELPVQAVQVLPYILTVLLLAGFVGRAVAPAALGQPYSKDR